MHVCARANRLRTQAPQANEKERAPDSTKKLNFFNFTIKNRHQAEDVGPQEGPLETVPVVLPHLGGREGEGGREREREGV